MEIFNSLNLIRIAFASLFSFEFLNSIKILNWPLHFPWLTLALVSFSCWLVWEKIFKTRLDLPLLIGCLAVFQLYANTFGNIFGLYTKYWWYDRITHLVGGAAIGTAVFLILEYFNKKRRLALGLKSLIIFGIALALSSCVIYEFWEYFTDAALGYHDVIVDKYDTPRDLVFGLIGITISITLLALRTRRRQNST